MYGSPNANMSSFSRAPVPSSPSVLRGAGTASLTPEPRRRAPKGELSSSAGAVAGSPGSGFSLFRREEARRQDPATAALDASERDSRVRSLFAAESEPGSVRPLPRRRQGPAHTAGSPTSSSTKAGELPPLFVAKDSSGETQRRQVIKWASDFNSKSKAVMPSTMAVDAMYQQLVTHTAHLDQPSSLRVATSFWLLRQVCATLETKAGLIDKLVEDVRQGLFLPSAASNADLRPNTEYHAAHLSALGLDPQCGIYDLLSHKPFFESHTELAAKVKKLERRVEHTNHLHVAQRAVLNVCATKWQFVIKGAVFRSWRRVVELERLRLASVAQFAKRYDKRDRLQTHFYAWRFAVVGAGAERSRHQAAEGVDALVVTEATTHARVMELEDSQEELRMVVSRLKREKDGWKEERATMLKTLETHVGRSEGWRDLSVDSLRFLGELRDHVLSVSAVSGADMAVAMETATRVILGWAGQCVKALPQGSKAKVNNFGSDLRDGSVYILLLHSVAPEAMSLECLGQKESRRRFEVALDAMATLGIKAPFNASELVAATTDVHFVTLFTLWWHCCKPPTPSPDTCLEQPGSYRDDLSATQGYLQDCRAFYPDWLMHRAVLAQFCHYVILCRARGSPAKVVAAEEEKQALRDMSHFAIEAGRKVPDVFLDLAFMTAHHRNLNEDERARVNAQVLLHIGLLRPVFQYYTGSSAKPAGDGGKDSKTSSPKHGKKGGEFEKMDFVAFYRFCEDCRVVQSQSDTSAPDAAATGGVPAASGGNSPGPGASPTTAAAAAAGGANGASIDSANAGMLPKLTKPQCYAIFMDLYERFGSALPTTKKGGMASSVKVEKARAGMRDAHLTPASWIAACLRIAVLRHAPGALPLNSAPAPAAHALDEFLATSVAPYACATSASAFEQELWSPALQELLGRKRKQLIPFFEHYAGLDGNGTMDFGELVEALNAVGGITTLGVEEAVVRRTFAHLTGASEANPMVSAAAAAKEAAAAVVKETAEGDAGGDATAAEDDEESEPTDSDDEDDMPAMVYGEFETLLVMLAVYADPAPFTPLAVKAQQLLDPFASQVQADLKRIARAALDH